MNKRNSLLLALGVAVTMQCAGQTVVHPGGKKGSYASYTPLNLCMSEDHVPGDYGFQGDQSRLMQTRRLWIHEREGQPIPTNDWWTNLITQPYSGRMWSYPQFVQAQNYGVDVQAPSYWISDGTEMKSNTTVSVRGENFYPESAVAEEWHDWDVQFEMRDGNKRMYTTMAHGIPFTWIETEGFDPTVTISRSYQASAEFTATDARVMDTEGNTVNGSMESDCLILAMGPDLYAVYMPAGTSVTVRGGTMSLKFNGRRQFVVIGVIHDVEDAVTMKPYACHVPRSSRVDHTYTPGKLKTLWHIDAEDLNSESGTVAALPVMQGFLPHHYRDTGNQPGFAFNGFTYATPRGKLKMATGNDFEITYDFYGMLPYYAVPQSGDSSEHPYDAARMKEMLLNYAAKGSFGDDTYWGGKGLSQMALNMMFAREMGETELFDTCRKRLKDALVNWLTWTPGEQRNFFARCDRWGGMVGYATSYDSDTFNDHHFHYGYFTYAAALLALVDDEFRDNYGDMLTLIAKDYANWDREDTDFPLYRTFDPWAGHSFAGGMGDDNGNGQESTSEAMQGWGGLYLLGVALRNDAMRDAGIFGWVSEARGTAEYWFDRHSDPDTGKPGYHSSVSDDYNINYDLFRKDGKTHPYNSNLTCHGVGFWTYFGYDAIFMQGIQWMPISPALDYLSEDKAFAKWDWDRMWSDKSIGGWLASDRTDDGYLGDSGGWGNVALSYMQRSDPEGAAAVFDQCWEAREPEFYTYDTNGISYFVTHSHLSYGDIDWSIHASIPTARVYVRNGVKTYMAFNPGDNAVNVTFSDGFRLEDVAPRRLKVSGVESLDNTSITTAEDVKEDPRDRIEMLNLALRKDVTTSGNENDGFLPSYITDGDHSTRWASLKEDNQWLMIDLGKPALLYQVRIHWETAAPYDYKILFSTDKDVWTEVADVPNCAGGTETIATDDMTARYVKIQCGKRRADTWGVSLFEVEAFGCYEDAPDSELLGMMIEAEKDVLKQHEAARVRATGLTKGLQWVDVTPQWSCAADQGEITADGMFTPAVYPKATVSAEVNGVSVSKGLIVEEAIYPRYLSLSPQSCVMAAGYDMEPELEVLDQFKGAMDHNQANLIWNVTDREGNPSQGVTVDGTVPRLHAVSCGEYIVTVANPAGTLSASIDVTVKKVDEINLALGIAVGGEARARATSSTNDVAVRTAEDAIDGDNATRWEAPASEILNESDVTWTLDLGSSRDFNTIVIQWENAYSSDYDIAVSDDGTTFNVIKEVRGFNAAAGLTQVLQPGARNARYIRFINRGRGTAYGVSFYEFMVYNLTEGLQLTEMSLASDFAISPAGGKLNLTLEGMNQLGIRHPVGDVTYELAEADVSKASGNPGTIEGNIYTAGDPGQYTITAVSTSGVRSNPLNVHVFEGEKIVIDPANVTVHDGTRDDGMSNAFDEDINSLWVMRDHPGTRDYETGFTVDLGKAYRMTALSLAFEGACSQSYIIDFSADGRSFDTPFEYNGSEGIKELRERSLHSTAPVRYARFRSTKAATDYGVKLRDFSLYAIPANPTGINSVACDANPLHAPYTVCTPDGRLIVYKGARLPKLSPGIYLINGKTVRL